jgi:hypothetical protein
MLFKIVVHSNKHFAQKCMYIPIEDRRYLSNLRETETCIHILVEVSNITFHEDSTALLKLLHAGKRTDIAKLIGRFLHILFLICLKR